MTSEQIERGLTNECSYVRWSFAKRTDFVPTPAQVDRGLTDEHWDIRRTFAQRTDFTPTPAQIERGLKDIASEVRLVFLYRRAESGADKLKKLQAVITSEIPRLGAL